MVAQTPQAGGEGMNLPKLPNHINKVERSVINFGGLNFSDTAKDGEFAACKNLSGRRLPYLTQRPGRVFDETYAPGVCHSPPQSGYQQQAQARVVPLCGTYRCG